MRAYVFRFALELGHRVMMSALRICAKLRHSRQLNSGDFRCGPDDWTFAVDTNQRKVFKGVVYLKMRRLSSLWGAPNEEENPMRKRFIATFVCSALSLIGASGFALAETIGRYECSFIGTASQEPIGDRTGHSLSSNQYSCFGVDGLLKGAVYTGSSIGVGGSPGNVFL